MLLHFLHAKQLADFAVLVGAELEHLLHLRIPIKKRNTD